MENSVKRCFSVGPVGPPSIFHRLLDKRGDRDVYPLPFPSLPFPEPTAELFFENSYPHTPKKLILILAAKKM